MIGLAAGPHQHIARGDRPCALIVARIGGEIVVFIRKAQEEAVVQVGRKLDPVIVRDAADAPAGRGIRKRRLRRGDVEFLIIRIAARLQREHFPARSVREREGIRRKLPRSPHGGLGDRVGRGGSGFERAGDPVERGVGPEAALDRRVVHRKAAVLRAVVGHADECVLAAVRQFRGVRDLRPLVLRAARDAVAVDRAERRILRYAVLTAARGDLRNVRRVGNVRLRPAEEHVFRAVDRRVQTDGQREDVARVGVHRRRVQTDRIREGDGDRRFYRKYDRHGAVRGHIGHAEGIAGARQQRRALGRNGRVLHVVSGVRHGVHGAPGHGNAAPRGIVRDRADRVAHTAAGFAARR